MKGRKKVKPVIEKEERNFFLDYNKRENLFFTTPLTECDVPYSTYHLWDVEILDGYGRSHYIVDAASEYLAINYVATYLEFVYYEASAEKFSQKTLSLYI